MLPGRTKSAYLFNAGLLSESPWSSDWQLWQLGRLGLGRRPLPLNVRLIARREKHALRSRRRQIRQLHNARDKELCNRETSNIWRQVWLLYNTCRQGKRRITRNICRQVWQVHNARDKEL